MNYEKERFVFIFSICGLCLVLVLSVFLGLNGWYYTLPTDNDFNAITNQIYTIDMSKTQSESLSLAISGGMLPSQKIPQKINLANKSEEDFFLRAKVKIWTDDGFVDCYFENLEGWRSFDDDNYIYFQQKLIPQARIGLCSEILVNDEIYFDSEKKYFLTITVESMSTNLEIDKIWGENKIVLE